MKNFALELIKNKYFRQALEQTSALKRDRLIAKAVNELNKDGDLVMPGKIKLYVNIFTQPYSSVDFYISTPYPTKEDALNALPKVFKHQRHQRSRYIDTVPVLISFKKYLAKQIQGPKNKPQ